MPLKRALRKADVAAAATLMPLLSADHGNHGQDTVLCVRDGDQAGVTPDSLAVIDFDQNSANYEDVVLMIENQPGSPFMTCGSFAHRLWLVNSSPRGGLRQ